jgi:hypothetical protein
MKTKRQTWGIQFGPQIQKQNSEVGTEISTKKDGRADADNDSYDGPARKQRFGSRSTLCEVSNSNSQVLSIDGNNNNTVYHGLTPTPTGEPPSFSRFCRFADKTAQGRVLAISSKWSLFLL